MSESKFQVSVWTSSQWRDQTTTYASMEDLKFRNKDIRIAPGPNGETWGQVIDLLVKITELKTKFLVYSKNSVPPKRHSNLDADSLGQAQSNVPGRAIWTAENKQGFSYGIDIEGNTWMIEKTWNKA